MNTETNLDVPIDRNKMARQLKEQGRRILGYFCAYCPEEIVYAAGLVPIRVFGSCGPFTVADSYMPDYYCAHARGCLNAGIGGDYDYLDGIVYSYACQHTQGAYDSWARQATSKYTCFIDMPSMVEMPEAIGFFVEELKTFKGSLEEAFGVKITDAKLEAAIKLCNEDRALLRAIYAQKREPQPVVSGEEVFSLILDNMVSAKGEQGLSPFLSELKSRKRPEQKRTRMMVLSTELDDHRIFAAMENQGTIVVADNLCTGSRYIWEDVEPAGDPLEAIAKRYLLGVNCPLKHPLDRGLSLIEDMIDGFGVEKAMFIWPQGCDPMGWSVPFIKKMLEGRGIPSCWVTVRGDGSEDDFAAVAKATAELIGG
ncbi:MAG: 2-hydroxyacyl-CoA dehydratase family protein [Desulfatiglandales bacterium]